MPRDKAIAYLWPEHDTEHARHLLSESLYLLRKVLGDDAILAWGDSLMLNTRVLTTDVAEFQAAVDAHNLARAVTVYGGPVLDGFFLADAAEFERWVEERRAEFAARYAAALQSVAEDRTAHGDVCGAVESWQRLAAHDPSNTRIVLRLMEALEAAGDPAGALRHAHQHIALLRDSYGLEPAPELAAFTERLCARRHNGGSVPSRAAPSPAVADEAHS